MDEQGFLLQVVKDFRGRIEALEVHEHKYDFGLGQPPVGMGDLLCDILGRVAAIERGEASANVKALVKAAREVVASEDPHARYCTHPPELFAALAEALRPFEEG